MNVLIYKGHILKLGYKQGHLKSNTFVILQYMNYFLFNCNLQ